jgi:hypothetical protein
MEQQLWEEAVVKLAAWEAETAVAEAADEDDHDHGDIDWSDDGPDSEERATQQWAIVKSFETQKKLQDDARAREEDNDAWWRRDVDLSLQQAPEQRAEGRRRRGGTSSSRHAPEGEAAHGEQASVEERRRRDRAIERTAGRPVG